MLRHFDPNHLIRIETDASNAAMSGVLSKLFKDQWHPIAFFSRQFKGAEVHYSVPDKEMMAIVECFKHWRHYLEGSQHPVEVWTDHQNLQSFMKQPRLNGRQARWLVYLTPYDFIIRHRPGQSNPADAPTRRPDYMAELSEGNYTCSLIPTFEAKLARVQSLSMSKSQWASEEVLPEGLPAPIVIAQVLGRSPPPADDEADHLLKLVNMQAVTRKRAKNATRSEKPLGATANKLLNLIKELQREDPLYIRLLKEINESNS